MQSAENQEAPALRRRRLGARPGQAGSPSVARLPPGVKGRASPGRLIPASQGPPILSQPKCPHPPQVAAPDPTAGNREESPTKRTNSTLPTPSGSLRPPVTLLRRWAPPPAGTACEARSREMPRQFGHTGFVSTTLGFQLH